jgi:hypothetical protein
MSTQLDDIIEAIYKVLPASSYEEIRLGVQKQLGVRLELADINHAIGYLRKNSDEYRWTIPHVGKQVPGRYFAVSLDKKAKLAMTDESRLALRTGMLASISRLASQSRNEQAALEQSLINEGVTSHKRAVSALLDDLVYIAKKAATLKEAIREEIADVS